MLAQCVFERLVPARDAFKKIPAAASAILVLVSHENVSLTMPLMHGGRTETHAEHGTEVDLESIDW